MPEIHAAPSVADLRAAYAGRRVVVTGGAGFIGGHLSEALLALGASVCIVDDLSTGDADLAASLLDAHPETARFVHASILDPRSLDDALERAHTVFHLAAESSGPRSLEDPERCLDVNVRGTMEVCQASRIAGVKRVILASSAAVYGEAESSPIREDSLPRPMTPYAASKLAAECVCAAWARCFDLPAISLRMFNVFGPRQRAAGDDGAVVAAFIARLADGKAPLINGDGRQTRDLIHVEDAVRGFLLAGAAGGAFEGDVFNIGSGVATEIGALASLVADAFARAGAGPAQARPPEFGPDRRGDIRRSVADVSRARQRLGFGAGVALKDGLAATIAHARGSNIPFDRAARANPGADAGDSASRAARTS